MSEVKSMSIHNKKMLTGIICGLIAISIISIACAGAGVGAGNMILPAKEIGSCP
jgi:hypothetical protein